jgi:hypothetical protein
VRTRWLLPGLAGVLLALGVAERGSAQDLVEVRAGGRSPGEIKSLRQGKLSFDLDDMAVVSIEVADIVLLQSPRTFEVQPLRGDRLFGSIEPGPEPGQVVIGGSLFSLDQIAELRPIEDGFWARTEGYVDVGFDAAKAKNNRSLSIGAEAKYNGQFWYGLMNGSSYYQDRSDADQIRRGTGRFQMGRLVGSLARAGAALQYDTNSELSLDYRTQFGVGGGFPFWRTPWTEFAANGWVLANRESYTDSEEATTSAELGLEAAFDAFRYATPELSHRTTLGWYPSLTESGRNRLEFSTRTSYEVFEDFFLALTFKDSYDSKPPSEEAETNDWSLAFSVGWSW